MNLKKFLKFFGFKSKKERFEPVIIEMISLFGQTICLYLEADKSIIKYINLQNMTISSNQNNQIEEIVTIKNLLNIDHCYEIKSVVYLKDSGGNYNNRKLKMNYVLFPSKEKKGNFSYEAVSSKNNNYYIRTFVDILHAKQEHMDKLKKKYNKIDPHTGQ